MATYSGHIGSFPDHSDFAASSSLSDFETPTGVEIDLVGQPSSGTVTSSPGMSVEVDDENGHLSNGFGSDYFGRIHVVPTTNSIGLIPHAITGSFEVYNAYLSTSKTLQSLNESGTQGINLNRPGNSDYPPDSSKFFDYEVLIEGPVQVDAEYEAVFPNQDPSHFIIGQRSVVFPFIPRREITEFLEWGTDIMRSRSGAEQRQGYRPYPQRRFEFTYRIQDRARAFMENVMQLAQGNDLIIPVWSDWRQLDSKLNSGNSQVSVNTSQSGFHAGGLVVLLTDPFNYEVRKIDTVSGGSITFDNPVSDDWPEDTFICPAVTCIVEDEVKWERLNKNTVEGDVTFRQSSPYSWLDEGSPSETYKSREFYDKANYNQRPSDTYERQKNVVENDVGTFKQFEEADYSDRTSTLTLRLGDRQEIWNIRQFLQRRRGRLKSFYAPSWLPDIEPTQQIGSTTTLIDIDYVGYSTFVNTHDIKHDLRILLTDGTQFVREIVSATNNPDNTEQIEIDSSLGQTVDLSEIEYFDFVQQFRLDADRIELNWTSRKQCEVSLPVRTVER